MDVLPSLFNLGNITMDDNFVGAGHNGSTNGSNAGPINAFSIMKPPLPSIFSTTQLPTQDFYSIVSTRIAIGFLALFTVTMFLPGLLGHILVIVAIARSSVLRVNMTYIQIISFSIANVMTMTSESLFVSLYVVFPTLDGGRLFAVLAQWGILSTRYHMLLIAVYRLLAVSKIIWHRRLSTKQVSILLLMLIWMVSFVATLPVCCPREVSLDLVPEVFGYEFSMKFKNTVVYVIWNMVDGIMAIIVLIILYSIIFFKIWSSKYKRISRQAWDVNSNEMQVSAQFAMIAGTYTLQAFFFYLKAVLMVLRMYLPVIAVLDNFFITLHLATPPFIYAYFDVDLRAEMKLVIDRFRTDGHSDVQMRDETNQQNATDMVHRLSLPPTSTTPSVVTSCTIRQKSALYPAKC